MTSITGKIKGFLMEETRLTERCLMQSAGIHSGTVPAFLYEVLYPNLKQPKKSRFARRTCIPPERRSRYSNSLLAVGSWIRNPIQSIFSGPIQPGPEAHTASCNIRTGVSFSGVKRPGRRADHPQTFQRQGRECI